MNEGPVPNGSQHEDDVVSVQMLHHPFNQGDGVPGVPLRRAQLGDADPVRMRSGPRFGFSEIFLSSTSRSWVGWFRAVALMTVKGFLIVLNAFSTSASK